MSNVKKLDQITEQQINATGVVSLATRPNQAHNRYGEGVISPKDLQKRFDDLARLAIGRYNVLAQLLAGTYEGVTAEGAKSILECILAIKGDTEDNTVGDLSLKDVLDKILTEDAELKVSDPTEKNAEISLNSALANMYSSIIRSIASVEILQHENYELEFKFYNASGDEVFSYTADFLELHNRSSDAHEDIREALNDFKDRVNTLLNSDDTTLDQTKEIVEFIKSNKSLIDAMDEARVDLESRIDNNWVDIVILKDHMEAAEADIGRLDKSVNKNTSDIDRLSPIVEDSRDTIYELEEKTYNLENKVSGLDDTVDVLEGRMFVLEDQIQSGGSGGGSGGTATDPSALRWVEIPDPNKPVYAVKISGQTAIKYETWDDNGESYIGTYQINAPDQVLYLTTLSILEDNGYYSAFPTYIYENQWGDHILYDYFYIEPSRNLAYISFGTDDVGWIDGSFTPMAWLQ